MATLGKIRNRSGLLLAVIGIAMLAFILGDFMSSLDSRGGGSIYVGEVFGEDVMRQAYEVKVEEGISNWKSQNQQSILNQTTTAQIRSQVWDQYVRDLIMNNEFAKLGIDVSDDEFFELLQGVNVHPEISKVPSFQNQATGQFDRTKVLGYLKQIDQDPTGEARTRWVGFQKYLIGLIKTSKYNSLVANAMYVTDEEARVNFNENSQNITFNYVAIPFSSVADSMVEPTERELANYYDDNKS
ncbi:MAG: peptidyl-prolyl cis-trans isomerase D, partial [Thalassomonas sp.]